MLSSRYSLSQGGLGSLCLGLEDGGQGFWLRAARDAEAGRQSFRV